MNWVEVIHLRITENAIERIVPIVQQLAGEARVEGSCQEISIYRRTLLDTDLSILLFHTTRKIEKDGSSLGLRIASALKDFGMVDHNTWHEIQF